GGAAMQTVASSSPDIALLDVIMPERSGYEICAEIKKHPSMSWMPVLLLTGAFEPYDEKRAREAGADGHMTKPFESRALTATVGRLLAQHPSPGAAPRMAEAAATAATSPDPRPEPAAARPAMRPEPFPEQTIRMKAPEPTPYQPAPAPQPPPRLQQTVP